MKLLVGLGNPGKNYENTRHNIGFDLIDKYANENSFDQFKEKFQGLITEKNINGEKIILLKPQTYMNLSGNSIIQAINFYKINSESDLIVIYDDMDLSVGKMRVRAEGSSGGHNGIKSIIEHLGQKFLRIKLGIGKAKNRDENINFVLGKFSKEESEVVEKLFLDTIGCLNDMVENMTIQDVMKKYNKK